MKLLNIPFKRIEEYATLIDKDWGSCPNWIYIDLIHKTTEGDLISWCGTLDAFIKDLSNALYDKASHRKFYVSVKADCDGEDEYYIGNKILDDAKKVWVVEGWKDSEGWYFYDTLYEYELNKTTV